MPLQTTCIGAFPKPGGIGLAHWRLANNGAGAVRKFDYISGGEDGGDRDALDAATRGVVRDQVACGIDIPTDGEQRRENYIHYHCRHLSGIDFQRLTEKVHRGGGVTADLPTITGRIRARPGHFLDRDFTVAQAATNRPVKITVPGPLTIMDTTVDGHYGDPAQLGRDLADALNVEILVLAGAGCRHVQIDEPLFARNVDDALEFGIECQERCFHNVPKQVNRIMHMCCGYPGRLDEPDYPKADPASYLALAHDLDQCAIGQVSIEHAHRANDGKLFEIFAATDLILGVIDIATARIEPVEEIVERLRGALEHIEAARLIAAPDCGLPLLSRRGAMAKLSNLCLAAAAI